MAINNILQRFQLQMGFWDFHMLKDKYRIYMELSLSCICFHINGILIPLCVYPGRRGYSLPSSLITKY